MFDFNQWKTLYEQDPEAFEIQRLNALRGYIDSVPDQTEQKKLEHILFRIEMTRRKAKSPLQAALESSKLMWESFEKLRTELNVLQLHASDLTQQATQATQTPTNGLKLVGKADAAQSTQEATIFTRQALSLHQKAQQDVAKVIQFNCRDEH